MSSGFAWLDRKSPQFPDNQQLIDIAKWNREHGIAKPAEVAELSELDRLRQRATEGNLW